MMLLLLSRLHDGCRRLLRLILRIVHHCEYPGCDDRDPIACWYDDPDRPESYYCPDHAILGGYCGVCGVFCGGIDSFEFGRHAGFCETCESEIDDFEDEEDDEDCDLDDLDWEDDPEELRGIESEYDLYRDM
jgi:hypothetical protein